MLKIARNGENFVRKMFQKISPLTISAGVKRAQPLERGPPSAPAEIVKKLLTRREGIFEWHAKYKLCCGTCRGGKRGTGQTHPRKILLFSRLDFKTKVKTTLLLNIHRTEPVIETSMLSSIWI